MKAITVLLADDHDVVRQGLRSLLELNPLITVIGEAASGHETIERYLALRPDVIVMDVAMPLLNGFEASRQILKAHPEARILVLSAHSDDEYVAKMAQTGALGYMVKQSSTEMLIHAIKEVSAGRAYFSPAILKRLKEATQRARESGTPVLSKRHTLTPREAEVLQLVAEGAPNKQVAITLGISIKTVEKHRQHLMEKLNIHDTAGLTRYAISTGVIENRVQEKVE